MEIEGKIIQELPMQSGTSKAGNPWKKREWVLETFGSYPRKVKFHVFGDRSDTIGIEVGRSYTLSVDVESREFNGRWYTDVSAYAARDMAQAPGAGAPYGAPGVAPAYGAQPQPGYGQPVQQAPQPGFGAPAQPNFTAAPGNDEDLPF